MQHMVLSLSMSVPGGLSVYSLSENYHSSCILTGHQELQTVYKPVEFHAKINLWN